jgi:hypothetical protein
MPRAAWLVGVVLALLCGCGRPAEPTAAAPPTPAASEPLPPEVVGDPESATLKYLHKGGR